MPDDRTQRIPIKNLREEDGAHDLATSADMHPYLRVLKATIQGADPTTELENESCQ